MRRRSFLAAALGTVGGAFPWRSGIPAARAQSGPNFVHDLLNRYAQTPPPRITVNETPLSTADPALLAQMLARFPYQRHVVPGTDALATWQRLRQEDRGWPVVVGGDEDMLRLLEQMELQPRPVAEILARAEGLTFPEALHRHRAEEEAKASAALAQINAERAQKGETPIRPLDDTPYVPEVGSWPDPDPENPGLSLINGHLDEPLEKVHILILPTSEGATVPAYLNWGGWNACTAPEIHVAALRSWHRRFGAELMGISGDIIEVGTSTLPETRDAALDLAREHYEYCEDIVTQGAGTLSILAASLKVNRSWSFWWD